MNESAEYFGIVEGPKMTIIHFFTIGQAKVVKDSVDLFKSPEEALVHKTH